MRIRKVFKAFFTITEAFYVETRSRATRMKCSLNHIQWLLVFLFNVSISFKNTILKVLLHLFI